jgi:hypothetical protein
MQETQKQLDYIKFIENQTGIKYKGNNRNDASKYIDENKNKIPLTAYESDWAIINGY